MKYIIWIVSNPVIAVSKTGLHHSGSSPAPTFMYRAMFRATKGMRKSVTIEVNWRVVAVVPAQCQRSPSHQNVGAILMPMALAGYKRRPPRSGTYARSQLVHLKVSVSPNGSRVPQLQRGHG